MKVLPLYDRKDNLLDWALIDDDDFERAEKYKWRMESYERKDREPRCYAYARIDGIRTRLHHLVLGKPPADEDVIDHINHDGLNNMKANLRVATGRQNGQNALKPWDSLSEYIGVSPQNGYFSAVCGGVYLGQYQTDREAAIAHDQAALIMYGERALTNGLQTEAVPSRINCRQDRNLPSGVTKTTKKANPFEARCHGVYLGAFASADQAHAAYISAKVKVVAEMRHRVFALPIERNQEGIAVIKLHTKDGSLKRNILCDDDVWHDLMLHKWWDAWGYCSTSIDQISIKMHHYLMKSSWIDHKNGDKDDNRLKNLRKISRSGNSQNTRRISSDVPEFQGVYSARAGKRFEAHITCNGIQEYLGSFRTREAAALAYNKRALALFDTPKLNDIDENSVDKLDSGIKVRAGSSRFRGVSAFKKRWKTFAQKDKVMHFGGSWMTQEEAAMSYDFLAQKLFRNPRCNVVSLKDVKSARNAAFDHFFETNNILPRGVTEQKRTFTAKATEDGHQVVLGLFNTAKEASNAYRQHWMNKNFKAYDEQLEGFSVDRMT